MAHVFSLFENKVMTGFQNSVVITIGDRAMAVRVWIMARHALMLPGVLVALFLVGCGGGAGTSGGGGIETPQVIPALTAIAPSSTTAGTLAVSLVLFGSNFENGATVQWNGAALSSSWVSATEMTATIPASYIVAIGSAKVTVTNPIPGGGTSAGQTFTIVAAPAATTWVRKVPGIATAQNIVCDATHGRLYVSISSTDTSAPNTIIPINPVTGSAGTPVAVGNNPDLLSISSDSSYLWVGLDGDHAVQRFLLPGLTKDISFPVPLDAARNPQQPVSLQAAPISPHTLAVISGNWGYSPPGNGVYVYDDATPRPTSVPGYSVGGRMIDWIQWGANDSTIYGSQYTTIDAGGVAALNATSSGVSLTSYNGGQVGPPYFTQYDNINGLLYSYGSAFNPVNGSLAGSFSVPVGERACTADYSLGRYYCVVAYSDGGTDVNLFELWIFDLNSYALIDRIYFGASAGQQLSSITGSMKQLVRWGNAGLALITYTAIYYGNGGAFLIDGAAVNPNAAPDVSSGTSTNSYTSMASLTPQQAPAGSSDVVVTIKGNNFTQDSTACRNCNYLQFQYLPTSYVSPQQLNITIPASQLASPALLPISVFDPGSNLFSTNSLTFTVTPSSGTSTPLTAIGLAGLAMAWDANSALLYVGTADYDGAYPNSIVSIDGKTGSIVKTQAVSPDPDLLSVSANGQYLYAAFGGSTTMTQLQLPGLGSPVSWTLNNPQSSTVYWAGDMKAAPESAHTTAVTLFNLESAPVETGGVVVYDDNVERPQFVGGFGGSVNIYDSIAWRSTDQILTAACSFGCLSTTPVSPLYEFQVSQTGTALLATGTAPFSQGEIHSDFGTGLIYSDDGNVADPNTRAIVGTYNASGVVAPDSSLNRVFILGQTAAQANTSNFTIESFNEKYYTLVSSITLNNLLGSPIELVRWRNSGLAVLTMNQSGYGSAGMLYLVQDTTFVSNAQTAASLLSKPQELVQRRWKRISKADIVKMVQARRAAKLFEQ